MLCDNEEVAHARSRNIPFSLMRNLVTPTDLQGNQLDETSFVM